MDIIKAYEQKYLKDTKQMPEYRVGDTLSIFMAMPGEAKKGHRTQMFTGVLIAENGSGITKTLTLRRISYGEGVEKVFPIHSPHLVKIKVEQKGTVNRSKLYYLRERIGKQATKVKQQQKSEQPAAE